MKNTLLYKLLQWSYHFCINSFYSLKGLLIGNNKPFKIDGLLFNFPPSPLKDIGKRFQAYEAAERFMVKKYLSQDDIVLELGACIGVVSCVTNAKLNFSSNHVVVEPNPRMVEQLVKNRDLNKANFLIEQCVVSKEEEMKFFLYDDYMSSSLIQRSNRKGQKEVTVKGMSIEQLSTKMNLKFNTLIMDIEGGELDIIKHNDLDSFQKLMIEYHPNVLSSQDRVLYESILSEKQFVLKDQSQNVEYWEKLA